MVGASRKITVEFLGNNRDLDRAMDQSVSRAGRFGSALKKAGRVAAIGLAAGAVIAGKALFDMTKMAVEDEASQRQLATQLKNTAGATDKQIAAVERYIDAQSRATGVADDQLRPALARLVTATGDVGKAQKLMNLALNVSAGTGKDLQSVTAALAKAQNGSVAGLSKLGIATKDAEGKTKSFADLQQDMAKKFKGASAAAADTMAGKMARLKVALSEAGESIGYKLLPIAVKLADWFVAKGMPAIENFGAVIRDKLIPIFSHITDVVKQVFGGMNGDVGGTLGELKATISDVVGAIRALWKVFGDDITRYTKAAFTNALQVIRGVLQVIRGVIKVFSSLFKGDWKGVWEGVKTILRGALNIIQGLVKQSLNILRTVWGAGWKAIKALLGSIWDGIKSIVAKGAGAVVEYFKQLPVRVKAMLKELPGDLKRIGGQIIDGLVKGIKAMAYKVWDVVSGIVDKIPKKIRDIMGISSPSKVTMYLGEMIGEGLARGIAKGGTKAEDAMKKHLERLKDRLSSVKDLFTSLRDSVAGAFTGDLFSAETAGDFLANLTSTSGTLSKLKQAFKTLQGWGLKPGFLAQLFQSGNAGLILDLAADKATAQAAGSQFGDVMGLSSGLGNLAGQDSYGAEIQRLQEQIAELKGKGWGDKSDKKINVTVNGALDPIAVGRQIEKILVQYQQSASGRPLAFSTR